MFSSCVEYHFTIFIPQFLNTLTKTCIFHNFQNLWLGGARKIFQNFRILMSSSCSAPQNAPNRGVRPCIFDKKCNSDHPNGHIPGPTPASSSVPVPAAPDKMCRFRWLRLRLRIPDRNMGLLTNCHHCLFCGFH